MIRGSRHRRVRPPARLLPYQAYPPAPCTHPCRHLNGRPSLPPPPSPFRSILVASIGAAEARIEVREGGTRLPSLPSLPSSPSLPPLPSLPSLPFTPLTPLSLLLSPPSLAADTPSLPLRPPRSSSVSRPSPPSTPSTPASLRCLNEGRGPLRGQGGGLRRLPHLPLQSRADDGLTI